MTTANKSNRPKSTIRDHIKNFSTALFLVLTPLIMLEIILGVFDPWGIVYFDDIVKMSEDFVTDEQRFYILPDGRYTYSHWSATTVEYDEPSCRVVLLGDSVTFGYGVDNNMFGAMSLQISTLILKSSTQVSHNIPARLFWALIRHLMMQMPTYIWSSIMIG